MKTHFAIDKMLPSYEIRSVFGGPALIRKTVNYCGSKAYSRTTNQTHVNCRACLRKLGKI